MKKKPPTFFVGSDSDPRTVRRAISGLRAMSRLGRMAEATLLELETRGSTDRRTAWVSFHPGMKRRLTSAWVNVGKFEAYLPSDRADAPKLSKIKAEVGAIRTDSATLRKTSDVFAVLPSMAGSEPWCWEPRRRKIGVLRYTKSGGSFTPEFSGDDADTKWKAYLIRLRKPGQSDKDKNALATCLANHMVGDHAPKEPRVAEMSRALRLWLVQEGVVDRIFASLFGAAYRHSVVREVMTK